MKSYNFRVIENWLKASLVLYKRELQEDSKKLCYYFVLGCLLKTTY